MKKLIKKIKDFKIKRKKLLIVGMLLCIALIICSMFLLRVNAETMGFTYANGIFFERTGSHYTSNGVPFYTMDGKVVYCVEPGVEVTTYSYYKVDWSNAHLPYSLDLFKKVQLIGYYGYEYPGHNTERYRVATQVLIWETLSTDDIRLTTERYGEGSEVSVDYEKNEIMKLVNAHTTRPSFNGDTKNTYLNQEITVTDSNGVLSQFEIVDKGGNDAEIVGNTLHITPKTLNSSTIKLAKKNYDKNTTMLYRGSDGSQVLGALRAMDPVTAVINLDTVGGKVTIRKVDRKTVSVQGDGLLSNAVYGIYDENDVLLEKITTDANGEATSNYLPKIGNLKLKELSPSRGYQLDKTVYNFEITPEQIHPTVRVYEDVVERDLSIFKVLSSDKTGIMTGEPNVTFEIYLKSKNKLYTTITTDNKGYAEATLPYGTYIIKQKNATPDYEKAKDFEVVIDENSPKTVREVISNSPISAKLKVIKVDKETNEQIKLAGIKFKIKNTDTNEYVCQTITYPTAKKVCEYETNENGEFITPYELDVGNFQLEEVDDKIIGYLWNNTPIKFHIGEGTVFEKDDEYGMIYTVRFANKRVKGKVELNKLGEEAVFTEEGITYKKIPLEKVKFGLYANEDIKVNGKIKYTKDALIKEVETDKKGHLAVENLELGKYYFKELKTTDSHVLSTKKYEFELKYKDQYTEVVDKTFEVENFLKKQDVEINKTDLSESEALPNAKIEIYSDDGSENGILIFTGITDETGKITIKKLPYGKYFLKEVEAPEGYVLNTEKMPFEVKEDGGIVKSTVKDKLIIGKLDFTKTDFSTAEPLPNAKIEIYYEGKEDEEDILVFSGYTDENGKIVIEELPYGKYYLMEVEAPEGYVLNTEKMFFEILEDGEIVKATLTNEKVVVDVPKTGLDDTYILEIVCGIMIIVGIGGFVYVFNQKKKKK